ncbi:tRNA lysidine(34) synthetase TilS [Fibrobacter sp. UWEL]|uniref:tRNA lysidine(34) synthetase TilS n=1 Tax=Fibrobacter sp. UWEL TaxID=1896209 RepID=UPI000916E703|nr:tRNA lysidine(34) synthetase TilS [Fibrobacter sp. UWEL]SHK47542.1 tRNA(Ile)-lysidine synthetase, N-terminal domain-containing protein [Fibrobacter sp. UWEL]
MNLSNVLPHIANAIKQHQWSSLLLAVSGGLDSICLAHYFIQNKSTLGIDHLAIVHVHHGLREGSADLDEKSVRDFAAKYKVRYLMKKLDGTALKEAGGSLEENARNARYDALKEFAKQCKADAIVTAHHAGDQAETVYLRLRRGVGLAGLRGIQSVRKFQNEGDVELFRPFLKVTRGELKDYAEANGLSWREDESNSDTAFARNKIRHESLPHLESLNPGAAQQLCRVASLAENVYRKIVSTNHKLFEPAEIPQEQWPFEAKHACYQKVLALNLNVLKSVFESGSRNEFGTTTRDVFGMTELFRLWLGEKGFRIPLKEQGTSIPYPFLQRLQCKTILMEKCRNILWICDVSTSSSGKNNPEILYFNTDKISGLDGQWRYRSKGDTLWPHDEKIKARKLEQWLREQGIPQWMYDSLPLFASGSRIYFVEGIRQKPKVDELKRTNDKG